jgi:anti-anti-sigma factor
MQITELTESQVSIVAISGSVDAATAGEMIQYLIDRIHAGKRQIVLDLRQVDFMSSAGLRAILVVLKESRSKGGDVYLAGAQPGVENTLKMTGFTGIVKTFATVAAASAEFRN